MEVENYFFTADSFVTDDDSAKAAQPAKEEKTGAAEDTKEEVEDFDESSLLDFTDLIEEEEKPKEKKTETAPVEKPNTNSSSPSNAMLVFAKTLEQEGLISDFSDEDFTKLVEETGSPTNAIVELVNKTIGATIEQHINSQDSEYQEFVRMRDSGVDLNEYAKITKKANNYNSYKLEDVREDVELQKKVIREHLTLKGIDKEEIDDTIENLEDTNKLSKRAETALNTLKEYREKELRKLEEQTAKQEQLKQEEMQQQLANIRKEIDSSNEIVPGIKHNKQTKDKLFDMITKPAGVIGGQSVNAITMKMHENPTKFNLILAEMIRLGVFDGKWDSITKVSKTKAITDLEKVVNSNTSYTAGEKSDYVSKVYEKIRNMK